MQAEILCEPLWPSVSSVFDPPLKAVDAGSRFTKAPLRVAEIFALFPEVRRKLPEASLPFQRPRVAATAPARPRAAGSDPCALR